MNRVGNVEMVMVGVEVVRDEKLTVGPLDERLPATQYS